MEITYRIDGDYVYKIIDYPGGHTELLVGPIKKYITSETDTQYIYQWYIFNMNEGVYDIDTTNTDTINVDGIDYTPVDGKVVINKTV